MTVQIYLLITIPIIVSVSIFFFVNAYKIKKKEYASLLKMDIDMKEMVESERRIENFIKDNNLNTPSIEDIAKVLNVEAGGTEQGLSDQAYIAQGSAKGKNIVIFKPGLSDVEKNFVFAHELAHIINKDRMPATRPEGHNKDFIEQRADYTASAMLMPINEVADFLQKQKYSELPPKKRVSLIKNLCRKYNVAEVNVLRRIREVQELEKNGFKSCL